MPVSENQAAQQMWHKVRDMRGQFRQGQGHETESIAGFRNRVEHELSAAPSMEEFERALPGRFITFLIRDTEKQRSRESLGAFLRNRLVAAGTADLGYTGYPMPSAAEKLRSVVRNYLENTGRKELADEFDRVMAVEPDSEIERRIRIDKPRLKHNTAQELETEKKKRAYARGAMLAKLTEEFAGLTPETLEQPASDMDYRRLSHPYIYLGALASQMEALLAAPENKAEILFAPADREKCSHLTGFLPITDRVIKQMEMMSNPCYQYLDVDKMIRYMEHENCRKKCQKLAEKGGVVGSFALDIKAMQDTSLGYNLEELAVEADSAMKAMDNARTKDLEALKKSVKKEASFHLLQTYSEYEIFKNSVESYSVPKAPDFKDPEFSKKLRSMAQATKKLYKASCRYLKYKGENVTGSRDKKRVEAAKEVRKYAVEQMNRLKNLKRLKSVADDFAIEARRKQAVKIKTAAGGRGSVGESGNAPKLEQVSGAMADRRSVGSPLTQKKPIQRGEFYKQGKDFASAKFRKENANTVELDRRLKLMFFPDEEFDLYAALGLDMQVSPEEPLKDLKLDTAREVISHLAMKQVLRDEQRRAAKSGIDSKILPLAAGMNIDDFRNFMGETPSLASALSKITREDVYSLVAGEDRKALKKLSRKVALELPAVAEAHLGRNRTNTNKGNATKLTETKNIKKTEVKPAQPQAGRG